MSTSPLARHKDLGNFPDPEACYARPGEGALAAAFTGPTKVQGNPSHHNCGHQPGWARPRVVQKPRKQAGGGWRRRPWR